MAPNTTAKEQARRLYFQSNLTQKQIADITGVNTRTIFDWINQSDWKRAKDMVLNAPTFLAEQYYTQLAALNTTIALRREAPYPTKDESGIMRRITATLNAVKTKQTRSELVDILADFSAFAGDHTPAMTDPLHTIISAYLQALSGTGPAERLARIMAPKQAADAHQAHLNARSADAPTIEHEAGNDTIIQRGQQHEDPLPDVSGHREPATAQDQAVSSPCGLYGIEWVDYLANRGMSPIQLINRMPSFTLEPWMKPFLSASADPFELVRLIAEAKLPLQHFYDNIWYQRRTSLLHDAIRLYPGYPGNVTPDDPALTTQHIEYQQDHDPLIEENIESDDR